MPTPFFSVIIPTYNRAGFIADTLRSVLAQTFAAFEILVVDDGSKDNTADIVRQLPDARLQYYAKENGERGLARNYGVARAQGEYVLFLDSDDLLHPTHLATLHAAIQAQNQPNFIATKFDFNRNGQRSSSDLAPLPSGHYGLDFFLNGNALACNICVRRQNPGLKLFEEDRTFAAVEDWMFMLENTQHDTVYLVDAVTLTMNDHDARSMRADNEGLIRRWLKLTGWVQTHVQLTPAQNQQLQGHIHYLCAIHAYADNHRRQAIGFLRQAWPRLPLRKALPLAGRILAGPQLIGLLKGMRGQ
jgi:GalNAc5-diNAcBac-PP-undecaprenol beta-1,3-glucosyltransferase